jgi:hypothetical protein
LKAFIFQTHLNMGILINAMMPLSHTKTKNNTLKEFYCQKIENCETCQYLKKMPWCLFCQSLEIYCFCQPSVLQTFYSPVA